jgi:hypothetical protein
VAFFNAIITAKTNIMRDILCIMTEGDQQPSQPKREFLATGAPRGPIKDDGLKF